MEPYYTYLSLFDARNGKKLSENFYFNLNHSAVKDLMVEEANFGLGHEYSEIDPRLDLKSLPDDWFKSKKQVRRNHVVIPASTLYMYFKDCNLQY